MARPVGDAGVLAAGWRGVDGVRAAASGRVVRVATVVRAALWVLLAGNLVRLPALSSGAREAPVLVNDLALLVVLGAGALACAAGRALRLDGVALRGVLFAAIGAAAAVAAVPRFGLSGTELAFSLAYLARWAAYFGLYVVVTNCVRPADVPAVARTLERVILAFAAFGIVQSALLPGFAQIVYPESTLYVDWDPQGRRLVSTFLDPNFAGAFVCIGLLLALARVTAGARGLVPRIVLLSTALVLTASRSSLLAAAVGAMVIAGAAGISRRAVRIGGGLLALLALAGPFLLEFARGFDKLTIDASALQRLVSWARAAQIFADNPVIGIGFNTYGFVQRAYGYEPGSGASSFSLDGGLVFIAVLTGLVGLAVYVAMIWRVRGRARSVWRDPGATPDERAVAVGAVAATAALLVHSLFVNSLLLPFLMEPLWVLWGLVGVTAAARDAARGSGG